MTANTLRILSVDGGGVRGIIPARILQEIEKRTNKRTSELFDISTGTSTGSLVVLGLGIPNTQGTSKHSAQDIVNLYLNDSKKIFNKSLLRNIWTGFGLWGAKYNRNNLDKILSNMFGDLYLSQTLYHVFIPIYSITGSKPNIASTKAALKDKKYDFYLRDIAEVATAAPTYFAPKIISNISGNIKFTASDGGIYDNDPEIIALMSMNFMQPGFDINKVTLVSIGTGEVKHKIQAENGDNGVIGWLKDKDLVDDMMDAEMLMDEAISKSIFKNNRYRLEVELQPGMEAMDNVNGDNLKALLDITEEYIKNNDEVFNEICARLI